MMREPRASKLSRIGVFDWNRHLGLINGRRFFRVIDDQHVHGRFLSLQLQTKLFLKQSKN